MPGTMELGGVERSLIGLLSSFDYEIYEVDLFLYGHHGSLYQSIPDSVCILPEKKELAYLRDSFRQKITHGCFVSVIYRILDYVRELLGKRTSNDETWAKVMRICVEPLKKEYDLALSFFLPFDLISEKVTAGVKVGWIHTDYSSEDTDWNALNMQYSKMDYIAAVSNSCADVFVKKFPQLCSKIRIIENILPVRLIKRQAAEPCTDMVRSGNERILLSIGRFCHAKNFDQVPFICKRIVESGLDVKWYLIGFGADEALIRRSIAEAGMEDRVIILGKKSNPYPYIRTCDLYVQPSRYEGNCVCVHEAQMLGKPVVITRYATSASQLEEGVDGVIVPMDNEGCAAGIAALLRDTDRMNQLSANCKARDYSNAKEAEKLIKLMEQR